MSGLSVAKPLGSVVNIYWPGVSAASVLQLAKQLYPAQNLTAADANANMRSPVSRSTKSEGNAIESRRLGSWRVDFCHHLRN
jgi:hypothetical protein